jgi:hypothetical protein
MEWIGRLNTTFISCVKTANSLHCLESHNGDVTTQDWLYYSLKSILTFLGSYICLVPSSHQNSACSIYTYILRVRVYLLSLPSKLNDWQRITLQVTGMEFSSTYSIILLSEYEDVLFCWRTGPVELYVIRIIISLATSLSFFVSLSLPCFLFSTYQ